METCVIGICGGTGSGKTTLAKRIAHALGEENSLLLSMDSYYSAHDEMPYEERCKINYDHPDAFDMDLFIEQLKMLKEGKQIKCPIYDFSIHNRAPGIEIVESKPIILVEGILLFCDPRIIDLLDVKIFVDTDADIRILRRITRDINERKRTLESVIMQYTTTVKPMHESFVEPNKRKADIIVPEGGYNDVAFEMILNSIKSKI